MGEITNTCCYVKPVSFGVFFYAAIANPNNGSDKITEDSLFVEQCIRFTRVSVEFRAGLEPKSYGVNTLLGVKDVGGEEV